jgi:hypothetical protein
MKDYSYKNEGQLWILLKGFQNTRKKQSRVGSYSAQAAAVNTEVT